MNCREAKNLLFQYIENSLDKDQYSEIKKHLESCKKCSVELAEIKNYRKEMASLKIKKAPADFLEQINRRIDDEDKQRSIFRVLFFPVKIKIPIEATGLIAACIFIFFVFLYKPESKNFNITKNIMPASQPEMQLAGKAVSAIPSKEKISRSAGKHITNDKSIMIAKAEKKSADSQIDETAIYYIALLIKSPVREEVSIRKEAASSASGSVNLNDSEADMQKSAKYRSETRPGEKLKNKESDDSKKDADKRVIASANKQNYIKKIRYIVYNLKGKVISDATAGQSGNEYITIEIPGENSGAFLKDLKNIGDIESERAVPAAGKNNRAERFRIRIASSIVLISGLPKYSSVLPLSLIWGISPFAKLMVLAPALTKELEALLSNNPRSSCMAKRSAVSSIPFTCRNF